MVQLDRTETDKREAQPHCAHPPNSRKIRSLGRDHPPLEETRDGLQAEDRLIDVQAPDDVAQGARQRHGVRVVRRGTLATVDEAGRTFPAIPGVTFPTRVNGLDALGFGPTFARTRAERVTNADESVARRILLR